MSRMMESRSPSPAIGTLSPALSLSPLSSPPATGSHAEWLERNLLGAMEPDDRWRVAIASAPWIPQRRPVRVDDSPVLVIDVDAVEMAATIPPSSPSGKADESSPEASVPPPSPGQNVEAREIGIATTHPSPSRGVKRTAAGEAGAIIDAMLLDLEHKRSGVGRLRRNP